VDDHDSARRAAAAMRMKTAVLFLLVVVLLAALAAIGVVQVEVVRRLRLAPALRGGEGAPTAR
jgi:hypothetical protein